MDQPNQGVAQFGCDHPAECVEAVDDQHEPPAVRLDVQKQFAHSALGQKSIGGGPVLQKELRRPLLEGCREIAAVLAVTAAYAPVLLEGTAGTSLTTAAFACPHQGGGC